MESGGGKHEADPRQWLLAFEDCCARLGSLSAVQVLVISGNGPSLIPVRGALPAAPARLWLDRRASAAAAEVSAVMGGFVDPGFFLPKALDIKNKEPELYEKTELFLGCPEYLAYSLSGEARTVFPSQGFDRWYWNQEVLEKLKLDPAKFPPFISPGETVGTLLPAVASRLGFAPNIPVVAGGPDFFVSILGAGVVRPGQVCDRSGTSEGINLCTEKRIDDARLMSYGHPVKPFWNLSGIISTTGKAIEWAHDLLGLHNYDEFFSLAASAKAGSGGLVFLPYLAGERAPIWDPDARGLLGGLSLSTGRAELARSVLEGIGFAILDVITVMEESGVQVGELRVSGSAAENSILNQIKADISGREVLSPAQKDAELLGLAVIGACALGKYASFAEAASILVRIEGHWQPDSKKVPLYERLFTQYREFSRNSVPCVDTNHSGA
jgi:xylulokinase